MAQIANVIINVVTKELDKAKRKLKETTKESEKLSGSAKGMKAFTKAGIVGAAVIGIGAIAVVLADATKESIKYADSIGKAATKLGITTTELQRMRIVAEAAGVSATDLDLAFQRFSRRVGEVKRGGGELKNVFKEMNIKLRDQQGNVKTNTQLYNEFATKLKNTKDHTVAMSIAMKGFDEAGAKMIAVLRTSDDDMKKLNASMKKYGLIMDEDVIKRAEAAQTELGLLEQSMKIMATKSALEMAPLIVKWEQFTARMGRGAVVLGKVIGLLDTPLDKRVREAAAALTELKTSGAAWYESEDSYLKTVAIARSKYNKLFDEYKKSLDDVSNSENKKYTTNQQAMNAEQDRLDKLQATAKTAKASADWSAEYIKATDKATAADESFFTAITKLDDEREQLRIGSITNEKARITALEDFKKEKAFNEIDLLKTTEEQKQALHDQYNENRVIREKTTIDKLNTQNKSAVERQADYYNDTSRVMSDLSVGWANRSADAITQMVMTGKADFSALAKSIVADIIKMTIQRQIFNAISGIFPGAGATSQGNQLGSGASVPVATKARGGIISNNTQFGVGGRKVIAGEAGAEAILPLKRDRNGNLGVASGGNSNNTPSNVNIEIINNSQAQISQQSSTGANGEKVIRVMVEDAVSNMVQNGRMDKVMSPYGLTRRGVR